MTLHFIDTRGQDDSRPTFSSVIVQGLAPGGGLYLPEVWPQYSLQQLDGWRDLPYHQRAACLYKSFGIDFPEPVTDELMARIYNPDPTRPYRERWNHADIAPVVSLDDQTHLLELWHGPTSAFKDLALQCLPQFFTAVIEQRHIVTHDLNHDILILVATSGDTGSAALAGFSDRPHTNIIVFYPHGGVSEVQRRQMTARSAQNLGVFGVRGNFDDCQRAVKRAFEDESFGSWLAHEANLQFSSANSINWGRLAPQIVYYLSAVCDLRATGQLTDGQVVDVCVPTGNFGNILAAWLAKRIGAPIGRLLCASNENKILSDFIQTGIYDTRMRGFKVTTSPSMDILVSSNLERLLFLLSDATHVRAWMEQLARDGVFQVDADTLSRLQTDFVGGWVDDATTLARIKQTYDSHGYLLDPHTAVALELAERERADNPLLIAGTAHWAKFAPNVARALTGTAPEAPLPEPYESMGGFELTRAICALAPGAAPVPENLQRMEHETERFRDVIDSDAASIEDAVKSWVRARG
ncbi:MAG: threonine synthase [Actinomycetes bacterium]|jgi:threonine synthase|nr:threonine synthase [Actinomycetes bacterium]